MRYSSSSCALKPLKLLFLSVSVEQPEVNSVTQLLVLFTSAGRRHLGRPLSVSTQSSPTLSTPGHLLTSPLKAFVVFLHRVCSWQTQELSPSWIARSSAFILNAVPNAFVQCRLIEMRCDKAHPWRHLVNIGVVSWLLEVALKDPHRAPFSRSTCFCQDAKNMFTDVALILTCLPVSAAGKG